MSPRRQAKCRSCGAPVVFYRSPFTANVRTFDQTPVTADHPLAGVKTFPVLGGTSAYRPAHLAEMLQVQRMCTDTEAADEVRDLPWFRLHECPQAEAEAEAGEDW